MKTSTSFPSLEVDPEGPENIKRTAKARRLGPLLVALFAIWIGTATKAASSLEATGSGFYGLSEAYGPFGRMTLTPQSTFDAATQTATVTLSAIANHHEDLGGNAGFDYVVALEGTGNATYGAFNASIGFNLQARPESVTTQSGTIYNYGHSELVSHLKLTVVDSGVVTSSTLSAGTPVVMKFIIYSHSSGAISEPRQEANGNPYSNGYYAGFDANGYVNLFDENSQASVDGALFIDNQVTTITLNSAVGHTVDLTAVYFPGGNGYAGLDGQTVGLSPFYPTVDGTFTGNATVYIEGPPGVSFVADSGHNYGPDSSAPSLLGNISTRGFVGTGENVLIGGLTIKGTTSKQVLVRALGPTLGQPPFDVPGALSNPVLELHASDGSLITTNDNWTSASNAGAVSATGLAPPASSESAILATLNPGTYTATVRGAGNTTGVALMEVYDIDQTAGSRLGNISSRGLVEAGDNVIIAGTIVDGPGTDKVLIRALGPTLSQFGVTSPLANPMLELHDGNGTLINANDNWGSSIQAVEISAGGLAPSNASESAIIASLAPGNYTAIVRGVNNTTGVALVEIYEIP